MMTKKNDKMNINEIMAIFVAYIQQEIEYTGMKIKEMKEWEIDDSKEVLISEESEPSFGETFSKEWL
tara:strand:- start:1551 stop:1751 length:201 start_codon:yes stop_codon:yes gene_type:complete